MSLEENIVIVGQQAWDVELGSNCINIALELSKFNRILYVNSPLDRITKIRYSRDPKVQRRINIIRGKEKGLFKINENLWVLYPDVLIESINWVRINSLFSCLNKFNNRKFAKSILKAMEYLQFDEYLLFNDNDIFRSFYLKELLKPKISIYYLRDYMTATSYWKRHGRHLEPKLIQKSDLVFSNSEYLKKYSEKYNANSYFIGQGCELELARDPNAYIVPSDLENITRPIIGYIGALASSRLDIDLLLYLAQKMPHWSIVLVGPEDADFKKCKLHDLENIYFLGFRKPEYLYRYINAFDVCINPQILNEFTIGNYPRKIDEYLAMGKPVVATKTETMKTFEDFVSLAENKEDFVVMIENLLKNDSSDLRSKRIKFAFSHTWENSVNQMARLVKDYQGHNCAFD